MTFKEILLEGQNIYTGLHPLDWQEPEQGIKRIGNAFGKNVGIFTLKDNKFRYMFSIEDELSKGAWKHIKLKQGEYLVRTVTYNSAAGDLAPIVKINPSKGLVWFLEDYNDDDQPEFETKSEKITSMRTSLK